MSICAEANTLSTITWIILTGWATAQRGHQHQSLIVAMTRREDERWVHTVKMIAVTHNNHQSLKGTLWSTLWLHTLVASEQVTRHHLSQIHMLWNVRQHKRQRLILWQMPWISSLHRLLFNVCCIASLVGGEVTSHVVARHLRKGVSLVEAMVIQPLTVLTVMHCHGRKDVVGMDMLLSDERANVNAHDNKGRVCLHWTGNCGMMRLAELLLCRADSHIDVLDDNGDTATILAAKMNDASVAMLMLGAGRNVTTVGELGQVVAQRNTVHEMVKNTAPFLSPDTMSASDAEATLRYCVMSSNTITALYSSCCSAG